MSQPRTTLFASIGLAALGAAGLYALRRPLLARLLRLPPPRNSVKAQWNQRVPMPDGVALATDLFLAHSKQPLPTVLIRTPYGRPGTRVGFMSRFTAQRIAERGYHVAYQDVRGRFDSEGEWQPYVHEAADGAATIEWIVQQPWSDGQVGTWGQSYVGYTQWAAAATGTPHLRAMVPAITQSFLADRGTNGFHLDRTLRWLSILDILDNPTMKGWERLRFLGDAQRQSERIAPGYAHLPLATVDEAILGKPVPFFRHWVEHFDARDPFWQSVDFRSHVAGVQAPVHLVGGWYDIFLEGQLADFEVLQAAGKRPYLTVGPWNHFAREGQWESLREALRWFDAHLKDEPAALRATPVRLYVMGAEAWRSFDQWPPPATATTRYLHADRTLGAAPPTAGAAPSRYRYDPADPTPNLGGALLAPDAGPVDNRPLEARPDVLLFATPPLDSPLELIGTPRLRLWVRSSLPYSDFFARLTVLYPDGRSINLCDGFVRVEPGVGEAEPDGSLALHIDLSPTAFRFAPGQAIGLLISSGAHPRIARNTGSGEPPATATRLVAAEQSIFHDAAHPSQLSLPIAPPA